MTKRFWRARAGQSLRRGACLAPPRHRHRSRRERVPVRTHTFGIASGVVKKKKRERERKSIAVADHRNTSRISLLGRAKIMRSADIFPIRLELMYRRYYGDASKKPLNPSTSRLKNWPRLTYRCVSRADAHTAVKCVAPVTAALRNARV